MERDMTGDYRKLCFKLSEFYSGTLIVTEGGRRTCQVDGNGDVWSEGQILCNVSELDRFPHGVVAMLPSGVFCTKMGSIWIASPPKKVPTPVLVDAVVPGFNAYSVIRQIGHANTIRVSQTPIWFHIPLTDAYNGIFPGNRDAVFLSGLKITVVMEIEGASKYSSQVSIQRTSGSMTKGALAQKIAQEVMKFFGFVEGKGNFLRAFVEVTYGKEVTIEDLFLVGIVPVSSAAFRAIVALRVPESSQIV